MAQHGRLAAVRADVQQVSLSGAAGTLSAMGKAGPQIRAELAEALGLSDPGRSWHSTRDAIATLAGWLTVTCGALGKMGEDMIRLSQSGIGEVRLGQGGGSSTMPQKSNPVGPSVLVAIARMAAGLNATLQGAMEHGQQRDAGAWIAEWMSLPQLVLLTARALSLGQELAETVAPVPEAMARNLDDGLGLIHAEALTFALTRSLPRPEAAAAVKALCAEARDRGAHLRDLAVAAHGDDLGQVFAPGGALGTAPAEARAFAASAAALGVD
jgi:3-carboxy-cis,cis-muconate cycloisomerase